MKKALILAIAVVAVTGSLSAQMMGGRPAGVRPGGGTGATIMTAGDMLGMMADIVVAPDGTVLTVERAVSAGAISETLVAYSAAGTKVWSYTTEGLGRPTIAGNQVLLTSFGKLQGHGNLFNLPQKSEIVSLNLSNGAKAWSLTLDGIAMTVQPSANQIYVMLVEPLAKNVNPGQGFNMTGARTLVAISNSGTVVWSKKLGL